MGFSKIMLSVLLLLCTHLANATPYYFSSTAGNDSNKVNSINSPYRSLNKANSILYQPGDQVLFKRGDVWYGTFKPQGNGTSQHRIVISAYGFGLQPLITGFTTITDWVATGNGIYRSNPLTVQSSVRYVSLDGKGMEQGRYPNADAPKQGWLRLESCSNGVITDSKLNTTPIDATWKGATLMVRPYRSYLDNCPLTGVDRVNNTLTFDTHNLTVPVGQGYGYFITNSLKTLDKYGEWYYNPADHCLYMYFGAELPAKHTVQASTIDILLRPAYNWYTIDRFSFTGANKYAIECNYAGKDGLTVQNCYIGQIGITGIALNGRRNFKLYNTVVEQTNCNGVILGYRCDSDTALYNRISDIGMFPANYFKDTQYQKRAGFALFSADQELTGLTAMYNHIYNVGFMGLFFNRSNNYIYKNYIHDFEKILDDGAGIYSGNAPNPVINGNNIIRRNVVVHGQGNGYGGSVDNYYMGDAIFVDDWASPVTIDSNVAMYCGDYGIDIHNAINPVVTNNVIGFNQKFQIHLQHDYGHPDTHATIVNNWMYSGTSMIIYGFYIESAATYSNVGYIDSNVMALCNPYNEIIAYTQSLYIPNYAGFYTHPDWAAQAGYDAHSKFHVYPYGYATAKGYYTERVPATIRFAGQTLYKLDGTPVRDSISLPDYSGVILINYTPPIKIHRIN